MEHWYLKQGDLVTGPFPLTMLERYVVLGHVAEDDLLSQDRLHWDHAWHSPVYQAIAESTAASGAFIRAAERQAPRDTDAPGAVSASASADRVGEPQPPEAAELLRRRELSNRVWASLKKPDPKNGAVWSVIVAAVGSIIAASVLMTPMRPTASDCELAPKPGINWQFCSLPNVDLRHSDLRGANAASAQFDSGDLAGADLSDVDLSYADLKQANFELVDLMRSRLVGADLRGANLRHANLRAADLSFADLRGTTLDGADLSGAQLSNAIWLDGTRCKRTSVGQCHPN